MSKWRDHNSQRWQSWFWLFLIMRASLLTSSPSENWPYLSMTNRPLYGYPAPEDIVISHLPDDYGLGWVYWKWIHTEAGSPIRRMDQLLRNWTSIWTRNLRSLLRELAGWLEILSSLLGLAVYFQTPREVHEKCTRTADVWSWPETCAAEKVNCERSFLASDLVLSRSDLPSESPHYLPMPYSLLLISLADLLPILLRIHMLW